jgi:hypothetical protein
VVRRRMVVVAQPRRSTRKARSRHRVERRGAHGRSVARSSDKGVATVSRGAARKARLCLAGAARRMATASRGAARRSGDLASGGCGYEERERGKGRTGWSGGYEVVLVPGGVRVRS